MSDDEEILEDRERRLLLRLHRSPQTPEQSGCLIAAISESDGQRLLSGEGRVHFNDIDLDAVRRRLAGAENLSRAYPVSAIALCLECPSLPPLDARHAWQWIPDDPNFTYLSLAVCDDGSVQAIIGVTYAGVMALAAGLVLLTSLPELEQLQADGLKEPPTGVSLLAAPDAEALERAMDALCLSPGGRELDG